MGQSESTEANNDSSNPLDEVVAHQDTMKTPRKMATRLSETSPSLVSAILNSSITKAQLRPNKMFLTSSSPSREELVEAVLFTAALRHCENEDRQGLDALKALLIVDAQECLDADKQCAKEWSLLVQSTSEGLTTGFIGDYPSLMAAILDSDMTAKQMKPKVNQEFLNKKSGTPTKAELAEALIRTAAKRHCDKDVSPSEMTALRTLLIRSAQDNLDADCSCEKEWTQLVSSPDDVSKVFCSFEKDETARKLDYDCDTEEDEGPSAWPHTGMKLVELKQMAAERGVDKESVADQRALVAWVKAIVDSLSIVELKEMVAARQVPEPVGHKSYKSTWADAIMDAME